MVHSLIRIDIVPNKTEISRKLKFVGEVLQNILM